ncbi:MAG TPA: hypothetical protein EYQ80_03280, partial [Candidatus Poseidoniales archaeon]|nr:hypothetical protein [Candidatus Poseidoniales archaeon]
MDLYWPSILNQNLPGTETFTTDLQPVVAQLRSGASLTPEQGMVLWNHANLATVATLADAAKHARFGADVFFNSNLHVNQTNICT